MPKVPELAKRVLNGDVRGIARAISLLENQNPEAENLMREIYPKTGSAWVIGVTGSPGAGKSTLTDKLIEKFRAEGKTVGVIAIDPSSPFSGGAILADRIRMQRHTDDPEVFIRSLGARGSLGGVSAGTREATLVFDAAGKDIVIIETVGVGQSEIDIMRIADTVCVVLVPGLGDDIQIMKAGIMEIADVFIVNKADREGADKVARETKTMLDLYKGEWKPPVVLTVAENGDGVSELIEKLKIHREFLQNSDEGKARAERRLSGEVEALLLSKLSSKASQIWNEKKKIFLPKLQARELSPYEIVEEILRKI